MAIPKLALIPSGVKAGKLYSVLPTNGDGDFTTTRNTVATRVNENGLLEEVASNVPRLDYSDGGCPSLLLEPERTNLFQRSEEFSNAYWSTSRIETPYIADVVSPDGTLNAYTFEISSGETNGGGVYAVNISASGGSSISVFAKKKTANYLVLSDSGTTANAVYFDLENGAIGTTYNATGEIEDFGNGWYRCTMKYTLTSSGLKFIYLSNVDGATNGGVQGGDSVYIYGAQFEQGSFPTSYIPNYGTALGITRAADTANGAGNASTFNDSEGVLMAEISAKDDGANKFITLSDGTDDNRVTIYFYTSINNDIRFQVRSNNINQPLTPMPSGYNIDEFNKIAIKYKQNDISVYINGFLVVSNVGNIDTPLNLSELAFDDGQGASDFYGNTKQLQYFDSALNDSDLEKLTSWTSFTAMANAQSYTII